MHSARLERSPRLQRVLALLSDGQSHSTRDIIARAHVCAVNSAVAELRDNGIPITCSRAGKIFIYRIGKGKTGESQ
jgi:biotin operon repressor